VSALLRVEGPRVGVLLCAIAVCSCTSFAPDLSLPGVGPITQALTIDAPAPPAAPEPALLVPCPTGWSEVARDGGASYCEPWAADAGPSCAADEARFPGDTLCHTVGTACGSDDWASGLADAGVLYVKVGAASGGTGTRAAPFGTIAGALAAATAGTTLALSKGTFAEDVALPGSVVLWGACTAQTQVQSVTVTGTGAAVNNLTVSGPGAGITANGLASAATLTGVIVDGAVGVGILVGNGGKVGGTDVVVRRTQLNPSTGHAGRGIDVEYSGKVALQRVALEDNHENAVNVTEAGTQVVLSDVSIRGTLARADGVMGRAATVDHNAVLQLDRAVLEDNREAAVLVGNGATLKLTDALVRETHGATSGLTGGSGVIAEMGATVKLSRCALVRNHDSTMQIRAAAHLQASHLVILGTLPMESDGTDGVGLDVIDGSDVSLDHAFVADSPVGGVGYRASTGALTDVEVVATGPGSGVTTAVQFNTGSTVTVERLRVVGSTTVGVIVDGTGTVVTASDVTVAQTQETPQKGDDGSGVSVQNGAQLTLSRARLEQNHTVALLVSIASATLQDVALVQTTSNQTGDWGRGLHVEGNATLSLTRADIDTSADVGLFVGSGSTVHASSLRVTTTVKRSCVAAGTCMDVGGSAVVVLEEGSSLTATQFSFAQSAQCGIQLAEGGVATLTQGEIRGHPIGACIATAGFDVNRVSDGVTYLDNTRNLDADVLPLPSAMAKTFPTH
jgi:hypothetical protein